MQNKKEKNFYRKKIVMALSPKKRVGDFALHIHLLTEQPDSKHFVFSLCHSTLLVAGIISPKQ